MRHASIFLSAFTVLVSVGCGSRSGPQPGRPPIVTVPSPPRAAATPVQHGPSHAGCQHDQAGKMTCCPDEKGPSGPVEALVRGATSPAKARTVNVQDSVRVAWSTAKLSVVDKTSGQIRSLDLVRGQSRVIPDSGLTLSLDHVVPDFGMDDGSIVSRSVSPENPAVQVRIKEGGKEIFKGWMFAKFPDVHPFEHARYSIRLAQLQGTQRKP